jgi:hypothetical protein
VTQLFRQITELNTRRRQLATDLAKTDRSGLGWQHLDNTTSLGGQLKSNALFCELSLFIFFDKKNRSRQFGKAR